METILGLTFRGHVSDAERLMTVSRLVQLMRDGAGRTLRIRYRPCSVYVPRWSSDYEAVANDWAVVGLDLALALAAVEDQKQRGSHARTEQEEQTHELAGQE